ncbi:MAG: chitobiase/beta-hexosaminidase C-terminal domain-containing protein, partial [Verrucomicrobiales bacterium]|nr:chitobiase/beta-hexosaminidase C-terminal domain-containing protein [Verrucomicrobiales bacterium]
MRRSVRVRGSALRLDSITSVNGVASSHVLRWLGLALVMFLGVARGQDAGPNLALHRPVAASGASWGSFKPGAVTDGDSSTFTHPLEATGTLGFYYEVDLGQSHRLERIIIRNRADGCCPERLSRYGVEVYADAGGDPGERHWSAMVREDNSNSGSGGFDTVTAGGDPTGRFEGRFVRIVNLTGAAYSPQVAEVEVYGGLIPAIRTFTVDDDVLAAGETATLRWSVIGATKVELQPGVGEVSSSEGAIVVNPTATTEYRLIASNEHGVATAVVTIGVGVQLKPPRLSEIVADNAGGQEDEDGDTSDWFELWNPNPYALDLDGLYLSDDPSQLAKWRMPSVRLPAGGFLVVFASGKDRSRPGSELHTNFRLNANGDWIGLVDRDGRRILDQVPDTSSGQSRFPIQRSEASYGLGAGQALGFLRPPTPGASNGVAFAALVETVGFSRHRGYCTTNFDVTLSSATEGAVIRYTLDRSEPTLSRGLTYAGPIPITRTTVLRAAAFREGWAPTPVATHTYVFPRDVVTASTMRRSITTNAVYGPQLEAGLRDLPSVVLVASSSISDTAEARASFEWIDSEGGEGVQVNCGSRLYGGAFTDFAKKNFRVYFRSEYGASKLRHDLFEPRGFGWAPTREFDQLELRSGSHDMEMRGFYLSNPFTDDTLAEMGHLSPNTRFVHLFLNGNYWGVYQLRERWGAAMHARYLGGDRSQFESINGNWNVGGWAEPGTAYDGDGSLWARIKTLRGNYASVKAWVDVPQYIDMMLVWLFGGCEDEYRCVGPAVPGVGMKFLINDADGWFCVPTYCAAGDRTQRGAPGRMAGDGPGSLFSMLFKEGNPDYRVLLADRIQAALGNEGTLSTAKNLDRLKRRLEEFQRPFLLESARWNYLTPDAWNARRDYVRSNWLPRRTQEVMGILRSTGFLPRLAAPDLVAPAGPVATGFRVPMGGTNAANLVYTVNGSDPRLPGGGVSPMAREFRTGDNVETVVPLGA